MGYHKFMIKIIIYIKLLFTSTKFITSFKLFPQTKLFSMSRNAQILSRNGVAELVLEYLSTSGFSEAEKAFRNEMIKNSSAKRQSSSNSSRLEDLLEKSYVTQIASGEFYQRKKPCRTHLDATLTKEEFFEVNIIIFIID